MLIYYKEVSLEDGFKILLEPNKENRLVGGRRVNIPHGTALFLKCHNNSQKIKCWNCSAEASVFVLNKGPRDVISKPTLDLFAIVDGKYLLMTRDHIIPKSLGGVDDVANLRPGCSLCNGNRGHKMNKADKLFMKQHPELIDAKRAARGREISARLKQEEKDRKAAKHEAKFEKQKKKLLNDFGFKIGDIVKFKNSNIEDFQIYLGEEFEIDDIAPYSSLHLSLSCKSNKKLKVQGFIHPGDLISAKCNKK